MVEAWGRGERPGRLGNVMTHYRKERVVLRHFAHHAKG